MGFQFWVHRNLHTICNLQDSLENLGCWRVLQRSRDNNILMLLKWSPKQTRSNCNICTIKGGLLCTMIHFLVDREYTWRDNVPMCQDPWTSVNFATNKAITFREQLTITAFFCWSKTEIRFKNIIFEIHFTWSTVISIETIPTMVWTIPKCKFKSSFMLLGSQWWEGCASLGSSARPRRRTRGQAASYQTVPPPEKN